MTNYEKVVSQLLLLICETNIEILTCLLGESGKLEGCKDIILNQKQYLLSIAREIEKEL